MTTFYGDLETFCTVPIRHGAYRYAEEAEIMIFSWAVNDGPVRVTDMTLPYDQWEEDAIAIEMYMESANEIVFQNSMFDRAVLNAKAPRVAKAAPLHKWRDTMVQAYAHSVVGALEKLCVILDVPHDKRKMAEGKALIQLFCKPLPKNHKLRRATRETHPEDWAKFIEYAGADIEAMRYIHRKLPTWNYTGSELDLWHVDQRINDRGLLVDVDFINAAIRTAAREQKRLAKQTVALTAGEVESTTQRDKLLAHILAEHDVSLPDMKGDTIERRLNDTDLPDVVRELLNNRLEASRASLSKYKAMMRSVCKDGRIRGTMQFRGAIRTGRWAGRLVQPQNFVRTPKYLAGDAKVAEAVDAINNDYLDLVYEKPMEVLSAAVPWAIVAPSGKKLVAPDLSNIEGRVIAWLAGEQWKLDAFRHYDENPKDKARDLYIIGYASTFNEPIEEVIEDYEDGGQKRQVGKIQELFLGYQGAVGAYVTGAETYGLDLTTLTPALATAPKNLYDKAAKMWTQAEGEGRTFDLDREVYMVCHVFTQMWRAANPNIMQFWWDLQSTVRDAIRNPGNWLDLGRLKIRRDANWLRIQLPSGNYLCYPNPKVHPETGKISYKGQNQYTRKWQSIDTYGGKLAENITQAVARDILAAAMPHAEDAGYEIVMHVHDELVAEVPDTDDYSADELGAILTTNPSWADGLPLSAGGYESYRYRKD